MRNRSAFALAFGLSFAAATVNAAELSIVGTGDGVEILQALAGAFNSDHKDINVFIPPSIGSGGAIASVGADKDVLGRVARPLSEQDVAHGLRADPLVRVPSAFFIHPTAGVKQLDAAQIADLFSGRITNWREVGGADQRVKVVRRENGDSTLQVLRATMPGWKDLVFTERSKLATTTQDAVQSVAEVEGAIGFGPYSPSLQNQLVVLRVDGKFPTDPGYPSAVTISLIHKASTLTPEAREFLAFAKSAKARALLQKLGGVPAE